MVPCSPPRPAQIRRLCPEWQPDSDPPACAASQPQDQGIQAQLIDAIHTDESLNTTAGAAAHADPRRVPAVPCVLVSIPVFMSMSLCSSPVSGPCLCPHVHPHPCVHTPVPVSLSLPLCPLASYSYPRSYIPWPHVLISLSPCPLAPCPYPYPYVPWPHAHISVPVSLGPMSISLGPMSPGLMPASQNSCSLVPRPYHCPHVHIPPPSPYPCPHAPGPMSTSQSPCLPVLVSIPVPMSIPTPLSRCPHASHPYLCHIPVSPGLLSIPAPTSLSHSPTAQTSSHSRPPTRPPRRLLKGSGGKRGGGGAPGRSQSERAPPDSLRRPANQHAAPMATPFPPSSPSEQERVPRPQGHASFSGRTPLEPPPPSSLAARKSLPVPEAAVSPHLARAVAAARSGAPRRRRRLCSSAMAVAYGRL